MDLFTFDVIVTAVSVVNSDVISATKGCEGREGGYVGEGGVCEFA